MRYIGLLAFALGDVVDAPIEGRSVDSITGW
jgi:hypothetical protein